MTQENVDALLATSNEIVGRISTYSKLVRALIPMQRRD